MYLLDGRRVNIRQYGKQCTSRCNISRLVFRYGWSFDFHKGLPPTDNALWLNTTGNYIGVAFHERHITHFAESVNMLLLKLLAPAEFPQVRMSMWFHPQLHNLFLPMFRAFSEYEWSKQYLRLLIDSFPAELAPRVWTQKSINELLRRFNSPRFLCFRSAALMDRQAYNKDGGIFTGFFSADWMRALSYKYAQVLPSDVQPIPHLSVVERSRTRLWYKLPLYLRAIDRRFAGVGADRNPHA